MHVQLPSDLSYLPKLEGIIDNLAKAHSISAEVAANIFMAVTEAAKNAMVFGNHSSHDLPVDIYLSKESGHIVATVEDQGTGFDFSAVPDPTAPENIKKITGRGIYLIKNLADEVEFTKNGACIQMKFAINN